MDNSGHQFDNNECAMPTSTKYARTKPNRLRLHHKLPAGAYKPSRESNTPMDQSWVTSTAISWNEVFISRVRVGVRQAPVSHVEIDISPPNQGSRAYHNDYTSSVVRLSILIEYWQWAHASLGVHDTLSSRQRVYCIVFASGLFRNALHYWQIYGFHLLSWKEINQSSRNPLVWLEAWRRKPCESRNGQRRSLHIYLEMEIWTMTLMLVSTEISAWSLELQGQNW
jgi:hypothetical protein